MSGASITRARARPAPSGHDGEPAPLRTVPLFWRLFAAYTAVVLIALAALVLAPIHVSVPTKPHELVVLVLGAAAMLAGFFLLLRRTLAPLQHLTRAMERVDPLSPGRRIELEGADPEVSALADAFNDMLGRLERERRGSARRAVAAQEEERRRIARELHDEIGQSLTAMMLEIETLSRTAPPELRDELGVLREAARHAAGEVRAIARGLRPEALDELGLQSALVALAGSVARDGALSVEHRLDPQVALSREEELVVYRVAQEALTNVLRHAQATHAELVLGVSGDAVELTVRDDGIGPADDVASPGSGLRGMRERALLIGADVRVLAREPRGTEVRLRLAREAAPR